METYFSAACNIFVTSYKTVPLFSCKLLFVKALTNFLFCIIMVQ